MQNCAQEQWVLCYLAQLMWAHARGRGGEGGGGWSAESANPVPSLASAGMPANHIHSLSETLTQKL